MKKVIIALAALVLVASACSKEQTVNVNDMSFFASIKADDTKAYLGDGESQTGGTFYPVQFAAGDEVAVKNMTTGEVVKFTAVNTGATSKFVMSPDNGAIGDDFMTSTSAGYTLCYPYNATATPSVAAEQVQAVGNAPTGGIAMKSTVSGSLNGANSTFEVVSTLIKVVLTTPVPVDYIEFYDGSDTITLTCEPTETYTTGFMMGVNVVTLASDATVTVYGDALPYDADLDANYAEKAIGGKTLVARKLVTVKVNN